MDVFLAVFGLFPISFFAFVASERVNVIHQARVGRGIVFGDYLNQQWVDTDWTKGSYSTTTVPVSDELTTALEIADAVAKEFATDPARQYITGLSMGGYGTWDALVRNPDRFAAARDRLVAPDQMGTLFKAMGLAAPGWPDGAGFS